MHALAPQGSPNVMLSQIAMLTATVRAYGDTFMLAAVVLAVATPLALLLPHKREKSTA
jgi:hypothetical protein